MKPATDTVKEHFSTFVGQEAAKTSLGDILTGGLREEGFMAPVLIVAPTGFGKTKFISATKAIIKELYPNRKILSYKTAKNMESVAAFFEKCLVPHVHGKEVVLIIDEFHEAPSGCQSVIRQMVEVTETRLPELVKTKDDQECLFDPKKHAIIIATNRVDLIDDAVLSRFERIDLEHFSDEDIEQILFNGLQKQNIRFNENSLRILAQCGRGNARDVIHWQNAVRRYAANAGKNALNKADVQEILRRKQTFLCGVTKNELKTLLLLEKNNGQQLQALAQRNLCSSDEQKSNEKYLMTRGFIRVDGVRYLTQEGREYLAELRAGKFIV